MILNAGNDFVLTICIPTYNRSNDLKLVIDSIICQEKFLEGVVEICISDNASIDGTEEVVKKYLQLYPRLIKYKKNPFNIADKNFMMALEMGEGRYLKLNNDNLIHGAGSLAYFVNLIEKEDNRSLLLFNGSKELNLESVNDFINEVSYWTTWIGGVGIWKGDLCLVRSCQTKTKQLWQVEIVLMLAQIKEKTIIGKSSLTYIKSQFKKGGYNFNEIFLHEYLSILNQYAISGLIKKKTLKKIKNEMLLEHCARSAAISILHWGKSFKIKSHFQYLIKYYFDQPLTLIKYPLKIFTYITYKIFLFLFDRMRRAIGN